MVADDIREVDYCDTSTVVRSTHAMGSEITIQVVPGRSPDGDLIEALTEALDIFHEVDRHCTRFNPDSSLMRANAAAGSWCEVSQVCFDALAAAAEAYRATEGRFDPRVHDDLVRLGYDRSRRLGPMSDRAEEVLQPRVELPVWEPEFRASTREVRLGPAAIDLGGIGKGLAVRAAAGRLMHLGAGSLIEAGGDCWCEGSAPDGGSWRLAVEDPHGGALPVAVLTLADLAVATSSIKVCSWTVGSTQVHHLIDPRTGQPGGSGLAAVTVIANDAAVAEVWSKTLFLAGAEAIADEARRRGVAAIWVESNGRVGFAAEVEPFVLWRAR